MLSACPKCGTPGAESLTHVCVVPDRPAVTAPSTDAAYDELAALARQALEHMEFAHYPQIGDGAHLADPFDLMDKLREVLARAEARDA
jgi:hypothetical protein